MGWLPQSKFNELREAALALTPEERDSLTWDQAQRFVVFDTIELARWAALQKSGRTPWQAVAALKLIPTA